MIIEKIAVDKINITYQYDYCHDISFSRINCLTDLFIKCSILIKYSKYNNIF